MIRSKSEMSQKREIDLTGPEGNAYCLLAYAKSFTKQLGYLDWDEVRADMTSGDYEHLLSVFEEHFGNLVTLYR